MEGDLRNLNNYAQFLMNFGQQTHQAAQSLANIVQEKNPIADRLAQMEQRLFERLDGIDNRVVKLNESIESNFRQLEVRNIARALNSQCVKTEMSIILPEQNGRPVPIQITTIDGFNALLPNQINILLQYYGFEPNENAYFNRVSLASFLGLGASHIR